MFLFKYKNTLEVLVITTRQVLLFVVLCKEHSGSSRKQTREKRITLGRSFQKPFPYSEPLLKLFICLENSLTFSMSKL
jgi:hypothetical protein